MKKLLLLALVAALMVPMIGCSDDDDDPPPPPPPWGPSAIGVGYISSSGDPLIALTGDMLGWSWVLQATSGITAGADLTKVVKIPGTSRFVVIADVTGTDLNDEIWYADDPAGAWTQADFGTSGANLDPEHRGGGTYDEWDLLDMYFVSATEGYAVGEDFVILRTYDAGVTWYDMNTWHDGTDPDPFVELDFTGALSADLQPGEAITDTGGGAGTVVSYNEYWETVVVEVTTAFTVGETATGTTSTGAAVISSIDDTIWHYSMAEGNCVWAVAAADGTHTVFIGQDSSFTTTGTPGVWMLVSNAVTDGSTRTYTMTGPLASDQGETGEIGDYNINALFMFDATTGVAATNDGVWYTTTGNTWTQFTATDTDDFSAFAYSSDNLMSDAYIYSVNGYSGVPGRTPITYTTGWAFGSTPTWTEHAAAQVDLYYADDLDDMFYYDNKMFLFEGGWSSGAWGWGSNVNATDTDFDLQTFWQDTSEQYMGGGTSTDGDNPAYQKGALADATAPSGYLYSMCKR